MGIFDAFKKDTGAGQTPVCKTEDFRLTSAQTDAIMARLDRLTTRRAFRLRANTGRAPSLTDSKFGGLPYWDGSLEYPEDMSGEKLMLLAQINLEDTGENELLPARGILQFFIRRDDDLYGCTFDDGTGADSYQVVWHETVDKSITEEQILAMGVPSSACIEDDDVLTPITGEVAVDIECGDVPMGMEVYEFEELFRKASAELGIDLPEDGSIYLMIPDEWHNEHPNPNTGHWMLGYPFFTQFDPRGNEELRRFDTLLLQIDSDYRSDGQYEIMWGDAGVGSFFINSDDLRERDFSHVFYTWDCG